MATALSTGPDCVPSAEASVEPFAGPPWKVDALAGDLALVGEVELGMWRCLCTCGGFRVCALAELAAGPTHDAGLCIRQRQAPSGNGYGRCRRTRNSWVAMRKRCYDTSHTAYYRYGALGKRVCVRWRLSLAAFEEDVGTRPAERTLERINNERGYFPGNCRWASVAEQARNTLRSRFVEFRGQTKCVTDWAEEVGLDGGTVCGRLDRGWTVERALLTPVSQLTMLTHGGRTQPINDWAREVGLEPSTLRGRLDSGWPPGRALYQPAGKRRG